MPLPYLPLLGSLVLLWGSIGEVVPVSPAPPQPTEARVKAIVGEVLDRDPAKISLHAALIKDLGADELDVVELVMALEEEYQISIADEAAEKITTVGSMVKLVQSLAKLRDLPVSPAPPAKAGPGDIIINLRADGVVVIGGNEFVDLVKVTKLITEKQTEKPDLRVLVRADKSVKYEVTQALMEAISQAKVNHVAFSVIDPVSALEVH